jgi:hypothetical protein
MTMLGRRKLCAVLGVVGALALLLGGLGGLSSVSAQEVVPETEGNPLGEALGRGPGLFGFGRGGEWTMFNEAADVLGLTPEELFTELHAGKTVPEVAEAQGVEMEELQETLSAVREEAMRGRIVQAVEEGVISQEQADWLLEGLDHGLFPARGFDRGFAGSRMRGGPGRFCPRGGGSQQDRTDTSTLAASGGFSL